MTSFGGTPRFAKSSLGYLSSFFGITAMSYRPTDKPHLRNNVNARKGGNFVLTVVRCLLLFDALFGVDVTMCS